MSRASEVVAPSGSAPLVSQLGCYLIARRNLGPIVLSYGPTDSFQQPEHESRSPPPHHLRKQTQPPTQNPPPPAPPPPTKPGPQKNPPHEDHRGRA